MVKKQRAQQILTQRGVEAARPKAKRYGKSDGTVPGLRLLVFPGGERSFALFTRVNGRLINHKIGSAAVLSLANARKEARRKLEEISGGQDPRATKREARRAELETVEVVARRFIERHAKVHNRGWEEVQWRIEREILPHWGKRSIASITKRDVVALLDAIVDRGVPVTANRTLAVTRKMFNWCCERSLIEVSPFDRIKPPAPEVKRDRVHTDSELALIWRAADTVGYPFGPLTKLLILTGQRRDEVSAMRWSELDPGLTAWTLPRDRTKNAEPHQIPVVPWVKSILTYLPRIEGCDYVFSTTGRTPVSGFSRAKSTLDAAVTNLNGGVPIAPWRLHDLRRSFASGLAKLGVALPTVEKLLNHISGTFGGVQGIYQRHDFADEKRHALERWGTHVADLVSGHRSLNAVGLEARA